MILNYRVFSFLVCFIFALFAVIVYQHYQVRTISMEVQAAKEEIDRVHLLASAKDDTIRTLEETVEAKEKINISKTKVKAKIRGAIKHGEATGNDTTADMLNSMWDAYCSRYSTDCSSRLPSKGD
jgi:predicted Holliday junction resolvase-like endonuclease